MVAVPKPRRGIRRVAGASVIATLLRPAVVALSPERAAAAVSAREAGRTGCPGALLVAGTGVVLLLVTVLLWHRSARAPALLLLLPGLAVVAAASLLHVLRSLHQDPGATG